jgi:hypothetical protein
MYPRVWPLILMVLGACAVPPPSPVAPDVRNTPQCKKGSSPPIGATATARVGDTLYAEDDYCWIEQPERPNPQALHAIVRDGLRWSRGNGQHATIVPGTRVTRQMYNGSYSYCTEGGVFRDLLGPSRVVCLTDVNADGYFDAMTVVAPIPYTTAITPTVYTTPSTTSERQTINIVSGDRKELVYQGTPSGQVKLLYREYSEHLARPAFYQDVTYQYAAGEEIQFQGVRVKLLQANKNEIRYQVLTGWQPGTGSGTRNDDRRNENAGSEGGESDGDEDARGR